MSVIFLPESIGRRWLAYINPFARIIDFVFGFFLYSMASNIAATVEKTSKWLWTIAEALAIVVVVFCICHRPEVSHLPIIWLYLPIGFLVLIYSFDKGYISLLMKNCHLMQFVGTVSLTFYMTHGLVYTIFLRQCSLSLVPSASICIIITLAISWVLERYILPKASNMIVNLFSSKPPVS